MPLRLLLSGALAGLGGYVAYTQYHAKASAASPLTAIYPDPFAVPPGYESAWQPDNNPLGFVSLIQRMGPSWRELDLRQCSYGHDKIMKEVAKHCRRLQVFRASRTFGKLTDPSLILLSVACPELRLVDLAALGNGITDEGIKGFADTCKDVESFRLSGVGADNSVSTQGFNEIVNRLGAQLVHLEFSDDIPLDDLALANAAKRCPNLELLNIHSATSEISSAGVAELLRGCPKLQQLDVAGQNRVDDQLIADLAVDPTLAPELKVLKVSTGKQGGSVSAVALDDLRLLRPALTIVTKTMNDYGGGEIYTANGGGSGWWPW